MSAANSSVPSISIEATFPPGFFLENIVALPDDTLIVTVANRKALYCLPPTSNSSTQERQAFLLDQFPNDQWAFGLAVAPQIPGLVFILTTDFTSQGSKTHYLRLLDVNNVAAADHSTVLLQFPSEAKGLNGLTILSDKVLLAADSFAGCIWRVDLELDEQKKPIGGTVTEWLRDPLLDGRLMLPDFQPGVNGLKYSSKAGVVCFSSTQQRIFGKVPVDPNTLEVAGPIVVLHRGAQGDDLIIDEDFEEGPVAYLATHRDNSILRIGIGGEKETNGVDVAQSTMENALLLGPTAGAWSCRAGRKTAYFLCDGGLKNPLPGEGTRFARVLRVQF